MSDLLDEVDVIVKMSEVIESPSCVEYVYGRYNVRGTIQLVLDGVCLYRNRTGGRTIIPDVAEQPHRQVALRAVTGRMYEWNIDIILRGTRRVTYQDIFNMLPYTHSDPYLDQVDMKSLEISILDTNLFSYVANHDFSDHIVSYLIQILISRLESRYPLDGRGIKKVDSLTDIVIYTNQSS